MKAYSAKFLVITLILVLSSCRREINEISSNSNLTFSIEIEDKENGRVESAMVDAVFISIKDSEGKYIYNMERLNLIQVGQDYLTDNIELSTGDYVLEDFLITDENDSTLYLTPKSGSEYADLIERPLPISFKVSSAETTNIIVEVLALENASAETFGYGVFGFEAKNVIVFREGTAGKEAQFSSDKPNKNYGEYEEMYLYNWTHGGTPVTNRIAIDFNLSEIPPNSTIDSAFLDLFFHYDSEYIAGLNVDGNSGNNNFLVQRIIEDWNETNVTWNNQPATTSTNEVMVPDANIANHDYKRINISELVKDYNNNASESFGFLLKHEIETYYKVLFFASGDHSDSDIHPRLVVYYH